MTIADRKHALALGRFAAAPASVHRPASVQWLAVRWEVCDGDRRGVLEWRIAEGSGEAAAIWRPEGGGHGMVVASVPGGTGAVRCVRQGTGVDHFDIAGLLAVTVLRATDGPPRVLYARTSVLRSLGIRGGRIDAPQAAIVHAADEDGMGA